MDLAKRGWSVVSNGFMSDIQAKNWSVYGQWLGLACFFVDIVIGVISIFHLSLIIIFSVLCICSGVCILFLEVGFLLRVCPITDRFATFIKFFHANLPRAGFYILLAAIQWGGLGVKVTLLLIPAIMMTVTSLCYLLAYITKQDFIKSATLGGEGVAAEMIA